MCLLLIIQNFILSKAFLIQTIVTLSTYLIIKQALFFRLRYKRYQLFKHYGIPGPEPSLLGGSMREAFVAESIFLKDEEWSKIYGKVFGVFIGDEPTMIITDIEILRKIFLEQMTIFKDRSENFLDSYMVHSLLFATQKRWDFMKKVLTPAFSAYTMRGGKSTQFIEDSINLLTNYIDDKLDKTENKGQFDLLDLMKATTLHLINAFAIELPDVHVKEGEPHVKSFDGFLGSWDKGILRLAIMFPLFKPLLQFLFTNFEYNVVLKEYHKKVNTTVDEQLARLRKIKAGKLDTHSSGAGGQGKIINTMIKLHFENKFTRTEIMGNIEAILFAGYDTTSTTLAYIFWCLGKHHEVQERLRADLVINGIDSKYLDQVIKETMRIYPTVMTFAQRIAGETFKVSDKYTIPAGTKVIYNAWLMNRDPNIWPEPEKFDPDRFSNNLDISPCLYAPFGLGHRKCVGYQLANLELRMIVCDIVIRYRVHLKSPQTLHLMSYSNFLSKPKDKIIVQFQKIINSK